MLENIKADYFLIIIFSHLEENKKLEIVKYNKHIQNKLRIDLIYYKTFSQKYFIGDKNGEGKEYDFDDNLIFEGNYLNGKRNKKGKEYYTNGKLKFDGEYLNGKRHGKGIKYGTNLFSNLFEGEYLNGRKWNGKISDNSKFFDKKSRMEGGKAFTEEHQFNKNKIYIGNYLNAKKNGKGKEYLYSGIYFIFKGEYLNGKKWNGKIISSSGVKLCEIKEGNRYKVDSNNIENNHLIFEGEYLEGKKCGYGKEYRYYKEIKKLENNFHHNFITSTVYFLKFEGEYLFDFKKRGKEYFRNEKLEFEGEYVLNKKWEGKGYDENGNVIYQLHNGNGKVKEYDNHGVLIFDGEYLNGKKINLEKNIMMKVI